MLSKEKKKTSIISFEERIPLNYNNKTRDLKPSEKTLIVIFITSRNSVLKLKDVMKNFSNHNSPFMTFFIEIDEDPLIDVCTSPVGNPLGLRFKTWLIAKCYDDNHIINWDFYSDNLTILREWAIWDPNSGRIVPSNVPKYTNKGLNGVPLRIATVKVISNIFENYYKLIFSKPRIQTFVKLISLNSTQSDLT